jgi:hypothetical protein
VWPAVLAALLLGSLLLHLWHQLQRLWHVKQQWRLATARRAWAESREGLWQLVADRQVSAHAPVFRTLFRLQTVALRSDLATAALSNELQRVVLTYDPRFPPAWTLDRAQWSPALRPVIGHTAESAYLQALAVPGWGATLARACLGGCWPRITKESPAPRSRRRPFVQAFLTVWVLLETSRQLADLARMPARPTLTVTRPSGG